MNASEHLFYPYCVHALLDSKFRICTCIQKTETYNAFITFQLTHSQMTNSKMREFADNNFIFDENGIKLFIWAENTEGKGEIAGHKQFLFFPQCFKKNYTANT